MKQLYVDQLFDKDVIERLEKEADVHGRADRFIKHRVLYIAKSDIKRVYRCLS